VLILGCQPQADTAVLTKFQAAQQAFDQAQEPPDFLRVAALYQEILDAGFVSGAVLYNQGNAFMKAGEQGRALACYRQAQRYRPRDPYVAANLRTALGGAGADEVKPLLEYLLFWQRWLSYPEKFQLSTVGAAATFGLGTLSLFASGVWWKRAAGLALGLTLVLAFSAAYDWYQFGHRKHGVIVEADVVARKGNAASYEPAFTGSLAEGTEFRALERRGGWVLIRLRGAQEGWVPADTVVVY